MTNNYYSNDDEMRPFMVKKMNLPPVDADAEADKSKRKKEPENHSNHEGARQRIIEEHVYEIPTKRRKNIFRSAKPLFVSIISAITIGVILGFIVLRIGAGGPDGDNNVESSQTPPATTSTTGATEEGSSMTSPSIELEELEAYVLQAGVYSEKENADEVIAIFENQGHLPVVWEKDRQYYVFTHVFATKEQAKEAEENMGENELETYAKSWMTENRTIEMSEEEGLFIQAFVKTWNETVEKYSNQEAAGSGSWEQLVEMVPEEVDILNPLTTYIAEEIQEGELAVEMDVLLLNTWILYEQIGE